MLAAIAWIAAAICLQLLVDVLPGVGHAFLLHPASVPASHFLPALVACLFQNHLCKLLALTPLTLVILGSVLPSAVAAAASAADKSSQTLSPAFPVRPLLPALSVGLVCSASPTPLALLAFPAPAASPAVSIPAPPAPAVAAGPRMCVPEKVAAALDVLAKQLHVLLGCLDLAQLCQRGYLHPHVASFVSAVGRCIAAHVAALSAFHDV